MYSQRALSVQNLKAKTALYKGDLFTKKKSRGEW